MGEQEYEYCVVFSRPTEVEIAEKRNDGWEVCSAPEGVMGRDLKKEPVYAYSKFYFREKVV